jgi:hypothetical protein
MGLDAIVYKNLHHQNLGADASSAEIDPETHEVSFLNDDLSKKYRDQREAASFRIGNISAVARLRAEAQRLLPPDSLILTKILYSGTHSGDALSLASLPQLSAEIHSLDPDSRLSPDFREFLTILQHLITAAQAEQGPIVFV